MNLAGKLPPSYEILESNSSLVLADASTHACFSAGPYRIEGIRFFAGVPLLAPEGTPIGVVCLLDSHERKTDAEDLAILEQFGRQGSLLLRLLALGRPESDLRGGTAPECCCGPGLEMLIDAEVRLLRRTGGSIELAVVEMDDPQQMREAVIRARNRERLAAGVMGPTRVAVFKRDRANGAAGEIQRLLSGLEATTQVRAVGASGVEGTHLPAIGGQDLLLLAELALEEALSSGDGRQRLGLQHERSGARDVLQPGVAQRPIVKGRRLPSCFPESLAVSRVRRGAFGRGGP